MGNYDKYDFEYNMINSMYKEMKRCCESERLAKYATSFREDNNYITIFGYYLPPRDKETFQDIGVGFSRKEQFYNKTLKELFENLGLKLKSDKRKFKVLVKKTDSAWTDKYEVVDGSYDEIVKKAKDIAKNKFHDTDEDAWKKYLFLSQNIYYCIGDIKK